MAGKILIIEDELSLQDTLSYTLSRQGYDVLIAGDGPTALDAAQRFHPDLILLDVMLPGLDGFEVCRILRKEKAVPILMLTARDSEIDRVLGLEMGADDYMTKPFSMRELQARVKAILRRVQLDREPSSERNRPSKNGNIRFENLTLNPVRGEVRLSDEPVPLKPKEYKLLHFLMQNPGQMFSREAILDRVWGWGYSGGSRTVDVHIRWLREKLEDDPANPKRIVTVRGMGYRFDPKTRNLKRR